MKKNDIWTIIMSILVIGCLPGLSAALDNSPGGFKTMTNQPSLAGSVSYDNDTGVSGDDYHSKGIKLRAQADTGSDSSGSMNNQQPNTGETGGSSSGTEMESPGSATTPEEGASPGTETAPGMETKPDSESAPKTQTTPGTEANPSTETAPGTNNNGNTKGTGTDGGM